MLYADAAATMEQAGQVADYLFKLILIPLGMGLMKLWDKYNATRKERKDEQRKDVELADTRSRAEIEFADSREKPMADMWKDAYAELRGSMSAMQEQWNKKEADLRQQIHNIRDKAQADLLTQQADNARILLHVEELEARMRGKGVEFKTWAEKKAAGDGSAIHPALPPAEAQK